MHESHTRLTTRLSLLPQTVHGIGCQPTWNSCIQLLHSRTNWRVFCFMLVTLRTLWTLECAIGLTVPRGALQVTVATVTVKMCETWQVWPRTISSPPVRNPRLRVSVSFGIGIRVRCLRILEVPVRKGCNVRDSMELHCSGMMSLGIWKVSMRHKMMHSLGTNREKIRGKLLTRINVTNGISNDACTVYH